MNSLTIFFISLIAIVVSLFTYGWFKFRYVHHKYIKSLKRGDKVVYINDDLEYVSAVFYNLLPKNRAEILDGIETINIYTFQIVDNGTEGKGIL